MQADPLQADPGEDLAHDPGLVVDHLEARHAAAGDFADIAVAEGSRAKGTYRARARGVTAPASAALEDLGTLVLGDHSLDLQQQVVLGTAADRAVEKHDLHARTADLLDQEHLVGVAPGQAIRGMDVDAVDGAGRHGVAQPLQGGTQQGGAAVALVEEGVLRLEPRAVGRDPLSQAGDLAGDGAAVCLLLARHPGVERGPGTTHAYLPGPAPSGPLRWGAWNSRLCAGSRRLLGARHA